jgi:hypothetical protein
LGRLTLGQGSVIISYGVFLKKSMSTDHYLEEFPGESEGKPVIGTKPGQSGSSTGEEVKENRFMLFWESLSRAGLGETVSRIGTNLLLVALALVVIWTMRAFYLYARNSPKPSPKPDVALAAPLLTATPTEILPELPPISDTLMTFGDGIPRMAMIHTIIPTHPRSEIMTYTVVKGDTIFGIAEKFNLKPETILWATATRFRMIHTIYSPA